PPLCLAVLADRVAHVGRFVLERGDQLRELVERVRDLAVEASDVLAQPHREVAALECTQRGEQLAAIELGRGALDRPRSVRGPVAVRFRGGSSGHGSSALPYSARTILSALAGFTMCASKPAWNAVARSEAWP